jgi:hypothetical protein
MIANMADVNQQIARFREDYFQLTGVPPSGFVCPITLEDVAVERVCEGHILNDSLATASSKKVVQFADVDHYFGATIEPDLINFLNFPTISTEERLRRTKRFTVKLDGETYEVFRAGSEAAKKFQRVDILDGDGKVIDQRYLKAARIAPGHHRQVEAEFFLTVHDFALTGALLKSAYLTIFKMVGYQYALDAVGSKVRRALAEFYLQKGNKARAKNYFRDFEGAIIISLGGLLDEIPDTLTGGNMLMHYAEGTVRSGILFAASCLFRVNSRTLVVTVPACWRPFESLDALSYYPKLLANRAMKHSIHLMEFRGDSFSISATPVDVKYTNNLPESTEQP